MGIFSSKKKIHVDTAVVRVVADNMLPNSLLKASVESVFLNTPMDQALQRNLLENPSRKFERMYRYAESGDYFYGLPNARVLTSSAAAPQVKAVIEGIVGATVTLDYAHFRPLNNIHMGWQVITETYGYNHATNELEELSATIGYPVYLEDLVARYNLTSIDEAEGSSLGAWGISPKSGYTPTRPVQSNTALGALRIDQSHITGAPEEGIEIKYIWVVPAELDDETGEVITPKSIEQDSIIISLASYDTDIEYHQAKFHYSLGDGTLVGYFTYQPEDGDHPDLDAVFASEYVSAGTYFPFAVFRREHAARATPAMEGTPEYLTTQKLLSYIDMDFQEVSDGIHSNPGIEDVEQAVLMMAVPANTEVEIEMDYLMRFFSNLESTITFPSLRSLASETSLSISEQDSYAVEISDADFKVIVSFDRIEKRLRPGSIGAVGTLTNELLTGTRAVDLGGTMIANSKVRVFRRQITLSTYEEILVYNAETRYDIYAGKSVIGAGDDDTLLIPLDHSICRQMPIIKREQLYYRSLHLVINSRVTEIVKWYQTGVFKAILVIIAIIVTIWSGGSGSGIWKAVVAAFNAGAAAFIVYILKVLIVAIIKGAIIGAVLKEVAEELGPEVAAIIAVIAIVYGGYKAYQAGGVVAGSTAANLLNLGTGLARGAGEVLQGMMINLQQESMAFDLLEQKKWSELEEAQKQLKQAIAVNPMEFVGMQPLTIIGETPASYFSRTIHSGNIGTRGFDVLHNYVGISLKLPTIQESLGDRRYL